MTGPEPNKDAKADQAPASLTMKHVQRIMFHLGISLLLLSVGGCLGLVGIKYDSYQSSADYSNENALCLAMLVGGLLGLALLLARWFVMLAQKWDAEEPHNS